MLFALITFLLPKRRGINGSVVHANLRANESESETARVVLPRPENGKGQSTTARLLQKLAMQGCYRKLSGVDVSF